MSTLMIEGFDAYNSVTGLDASGKWGSRAGSVPIVAGRYGGKALNINDSTFKINHALAASKRVVFGFALNLTSATSGRSIVFLKNPADNLALLTLRITADARLYVTVSRGTAAGDKLFDTQLLATGTWGYVEVDYKADPTAGHVEMWYNGRSVGRFDGATCTTGDDIGNFGLGAGGAATNAAICTVDDIYVAASTLDDIARLGESRIETFRPDATELNDGFTANGAAAAHDCVNDDTPAGDTTYLQGATAGWRAIFSSAAVLSSTPASIHALVVNLRGIKTDAGTRSLKTMLRQGAPPTDTVGAGETFVGTGATHGYEVHKTDPTTGLAWTRAGVEEARFGFKIQT